MDDSDELYKILRKVKALAKRYYELTGRPLGVTGEIAELEAVSILGLELAPVRQRGYDAVRNASSDPYQLQVKGRCLQKGVRGRIGRIDRHNRDWHGVLLVMLDGSYDAKEIFEADRGAVVAALEKPGSKARNERGQLSVSQFKSIARRIWNRE